jgi:hypothetical protein
LHIVEELPIVGEFISGLVIGIIALVIVDLKDIWHEKQYHLKSKYYQLMMTIQNIETSNPLIN